MSLFIGSQIDAMARFLSIDNHFVFLQKEQLKAQNIKDITERWHKERERNYKTIDCIRNIHQKIGNDMANGNDDFADLFNNEFKVLTDIGNKYCIQHHKADRINITDVRYYDYFFNHCLSLIALAIQYLM